MMTRQIVWILIVASFLGACRPERIGPPPAVKLDEGDVLFATAEKMFQSKSYKEALALYNSYLTRFSNRSPAPAALMKVGMIYSAWEDFEASRRIFQRLLDEYPASSFTGEANVEILVLFYKEGRYKEVIDRAPALLKDDTLSTQLRARLLILLGNVHLAAESPIEAFYSYSEALHHSEGSAKHHVISKLKEAITQIDTASMQTLLESLGDQPPAGHVMFQLGLNQIEAKRYDAAVTILTSFIKRFPFHEHVYEAKRVLDELNEKLILHQKIIGCLLPLSGPYKTFGQRALKGIELAINRYGFRKEAPPVKLIIKDTGSEPERATAAVKELLNENAAAIIGPIVSAEFAAIEAQDRGIPIVTLSQKEKIAEIGDYVFRHFITPKMQVTAIVSYASNVLGLKRFAVFYPDEEYGVTFMNLFWDQVTIHGGTIVGLEAYNPEHTDFADPIKRLVGLYYKLPKDLKSLAWATVMEEIGDIQTVGHDTGTRENPATSDQRKTDDKEEPQPIIDFEAVFIPDAPSKAGLIIPQLAFYDVEGVYFLGTNLWHSDQLIQMARQYVQEAIVPDGFFQDSASKEVQAFVGAFRESFNEDPGFIEAIAFDTAMILFEILGRPDVQLRSNLRDRLMTLHDYRGVTGLTSFDPSGEAVKRLYLLNIKGDKFLELR